MSQSLQFELVLPEKLLLSKQAVMVTVPGGEGDYGVLAGHSPLITTVRSGVVAVYEQNDTTISESFFVTGGFAEVTSERCIVLADEAVAVVDINRMEVEEQIRALSESLKSTSTDDERTILADQLDIAQAKLSVINTH